MQRFFSSQTTPLRRVVFIKATPPVNYPHLQPLCHENGEKTPRKHPRKHPGGYRPHSCKYDGNHAPSEYLEVYGCDVLFTVLFMFCVSDFYVGKETVISLTAAVSEHYDFF
jgi:hypothetical protein